MRHTYNFKMTKRVHESAALGTNTHHYIPTYTVHMYINSIENSAKTVCYFKYAPILDLMPSGLLQLQLHRSLNTYIKKLFRKVHFALSKVNYRNEFCLSVTHLCTRACRYAKFQLETAAGCFSTQRDG